jgi:MFS family permease
MQLFQNKNFAMFWLASIAVSASDAAVGITVVWSTWEATGSATAVGLLISAISLPRLILETLVGRMVDSSDRRKLMIAGAIGMSVLSLALTALTGRSTENRLLETLSIVWMLPAFSMLFCRARSSLLPRLVSEQTTLVSAQALLSTTTEGISILSGVAAILIPVVGRTPIMIAGVIFAGAAAIAAGHISSTDQSRPGLRALLSPRIVEGPFGEPLKIIRNSKFLSWFVIVVSLSNVPHNAIMAMILPMSAEKTGLGAHGFGIVEIAMSLGVIAGYLLAGRFLSRGNPVNLAIFGLAWSALTSGLIAATSGLAAIAALACAYGLTESFFLPAHARFDLEVQDHFRGRVNALFNMMALLLTPIAQVGAGALSDAFGPSTLYGLSGLALAAIGIVASLSRPRMQSAGELNGLDLEGAHLRDLSRAASKAQSGGFG